MTGYADGHAPRARAGNGVPTGPRVRGLRILPDGSRVSWWYVFRDGRLVPEPDTERVSAPPPSAAWRCSKVAEHGDTWHGRTPKTGWNFCIECRRLAGQRYRERQRARRIDTGR